MGMTRADIRAQLLAVRRPLCLGQEAPVVEVSPGVTVTAYRLSSPGAGYAWHHVYRVRITGLNGYCPLPWLAPWTDRRDTDGAIDAVRVAIDLVGAAA